MSGIMRRLGSHFGGWRLRAKDGIGDEVVALCLVVRHRRPILVALERKLVCLPVVWMAAGDQPKFLPGSQAAPRPKIADLPADWYLRV